MKSGTAVTRIMEGDEACVSLATLPSLEPASLIPRALASSATHLYMAGCVKLAELVQGVLPDGFAFLITLLATASPYSFRAELHTNEPLSIEIRGRKDSRSTRTWTAAKDFIDRYEIPIERAGRIVIYSQLEAGKGQASSSSDMALTLRLLAKAHGINLTLVELYRILCSAERSDIVWHPETLFLARQTCGQYVELGPVSQHVVISWDSDPGSTVSTSDAAFIDRERAFFAHDYMAIIQLLMSGEPAALRLAATRSSTLNEQWIQKQAFDDVRRFAAVNGYGIAASHTDTMMALLLPEGTPWPDIRAARAFADGLGQGNAEICQIGGYSHAN